MQSPDKSASNAPLLRTIVIVGAGFSGTVLAIHLLRRPIAAPTRIVLIERGAAFGRGVAYAARPFPYLLNVPASRMSANPREPLEFLRFVQRRNPRATGEDFMPRELYGEYLEEALLAAELSASRAMRLERVRAEVQSIRRLDRNTPLVVELGNGTRYVADDVVLALGNPPPAKLVASDPILDHPGYIQNPWSTPAAFKRQDTVLIVGTSLTMADVVLAASNDAVNTPHLHALSRRGLVPPRQTAFRPDAFKGDGNALLLASSSSLRRLVHSTRVLAREAEQIGGDWREAVTFVRHMAPTLWQRLSERDRRRFLRHVQPYWDVHRHRLPSQVVERIDQLRTQGRLQIHAGRLQQFDPEGQRIRVTWRPRKQTRPSQLSVDYVVNCTGPDYNIARSQDPLWRSLHRSGLAVADALGQGLRTGTNGAVIDADGWPGPHLFYVGPMLRADHWESTAAGELRVHAERLATHLSGNS
jgi:uncharacterized NAD(P)/FAD-binding protein YdhS